MSEEQNLQLEVAMSDEEKNQDSDDDEMPPPKATKAQESPRSQSSDAVNNLDDYDPAAFNAPTRKNVNTTFGILWVIGGLSVYVLVNASIVISAPYAGIAVALSLISALLVGGKIFMILAQKPIEPCLDILFGLCLVAIWLPSVLLFTFDSPFSASGTGFFSTWLNLVLSANYMVRTYGKEAKVDTASIPIKKNISPVIAVVFLTSCGVIAQATATTVTTGVVTPGMGFSFFVAVTSAVALLAMFLLPVDVLGEEKGFLGLAVGVLGLWYLGLLFTTFGPPFYVLRTIIANGFYASWASFLGSCGLVWTVASFARESSEVQVKKRVLIVVYLLLTSSLVAVGGVVECSNGQGCVNDFYVYAIAAGLLSFFMCALNLAFFRDNTERATGSPVFGSNTTYEIVSSVVVFLWWIVAVVLLTFPPTGPFFLTSSGYFGTWTSLLFAAWHLNQVYPGLKELMEKNKTLKRTCIISLPNNGTPRKSNYGLYATFVFLWVELVAVVVVCIDDQCAEAEIATMIICFLSGLVVLVLLFVVPEKLGHGSIFINFFFVLVWFITLAYVTFYRPFINAVGNGYYACWGVLASSVYTISMYDYQFIPENERVDD